MGIIILVVPPIFALRKTILAPPPLLPWLDQRVVWQFPGCYLSAEELNCGNHRIPPEMTSLLNQSGLNFQNGNPLGRKVRLLETQVETLQKEVLALKNGGTVAPSAGASVAATSNIPSTLVMDLDMLKREVAMIRAAGYGKGEKGDKGEKGEKGDPGPMTYIAMPANAPLPAAAAVQTP